jgi:hypothetical protein
MRTSNITKKIVIKVLVGFMYAVNTFVAWSIGVWAEVWNPRDTLICNAVINFCTCLFFRRTIQKKVWRRDGKMLTDEKRRIRGKGLSQCRFVDVHAHKRGPPPWALAQSQRYCVLPACARIHVVVFTFREGLS